MTLLNEIINTNRPITTPAKAIVCEDGFRISVQASAFHYCLDSTGGRPEAFDGPPPLLPFFAVECGFPSERPEPWSAWEEYAEDAEVPTETVYGSVPVEMVADLIELHGGEQ